MYDFILDNMKFSYSSANSFNGCPYGFFLTYIEVENRADNAFANFGSLVHETLEKYFKGELEAWDLAGYYTSHYGEAIKVAFPPFPVGMAQQYYDSGLEFFDNFEFDKNLYDIIYIEESIESEYNGIKLSVKPDLILKEKSSGKTILIDYKTARMKKGKEFQKQIDEYLHQFYLYSYFLWQVKNIEINEIHIWFIRDGVKHIEIVDAMKVQETMEWFENTIKQIKVEEEWKPNLSKENKYFCGQICSNRFGCRYNQGQ